MLTDFASLSAKELFTLIAKANQRLKKLKKRKPATIVRKQIAAVARQAGYSVAELFGSSNAKRAAAGKPAKAAKKAGRKSTKARNKVAPKYRNPDNHAETWSARGTQPRWLTTEIAKGRNIEEFKI